MYNGIYFQSTLFRDGRLGTDSLGRVCPLHSNWGVMRGNVVHSNERFGWYPGALARQAGRCAGCQHVREGRIHRGRGLKTFTAAPIYVFPQHAPCTPRPEAIAG
jgi:hypothetical protein